jgi:hypothetical protein
MEKLQCPGMAQLRPYQSTLVWTGPQSARKKKPLLSKMSGGCAGRTGAPEHFEEQPNALTHLGVRIKTHPPLLIVDKPYRERKSQFSAPSFVQETAPKPGSQEMELRFAHRAFQSQKKPIVKIVGIVQTVLIQNQSV